MKLVITFDVDTSDQPELWDEGHEMGLSNLGHETLLLKLEDIVGSVISCEKGD